MSTAKETLLERIKAEYEAYQKDLLTRTPKELVDMADEIVAAKTVYPFFHDGLDDDVVKVLSQFVEPLSVVRDEWLSEFCWASDTEMGHVFWNIQDKADDFYDSYELVSEREKNTMKHITTDDLRKMDDQEGLILQGCGGNLHEWVDGINDMLTEAGILMGGAKFDAKDVSTFQQGECTNLLFPLDGSVAVDMGKLAMWRLATHEQFGGMWLSDYVPNRLGGFVHEQQSAARVRPPCPLIGQNGNIYNLLGIAAGTLRENGMEKEAKEMLERVTGGNCHSYEQALSIIAEYVEPTDILSERTPKNNTKKKARNSNER